jgi:signal transduction histidine kinase
MAKNIKILMIDDDEEDFIIVRDILSEIPDRKFTIDWVGTYEEGLASIGKKKHDVYLVDYRLGAEYGTELIAEAIKQGCTGPLILLTGQNDREVDQKALKAGASDYLVKGMITSTQLDRAIRYSIEHARHLKEINLLNVELEKRVKDRTLILEEALQQLEKSQTELKLALTKEKELNDLKSRFVSMASHEFRTPLAAILSSLSLAVKYDDLGDKEKQKKHLKRIGESVNHLTDILNDILSLSKLEEGKTMVSPSEFDLHDCVTEIVQDMQAIARPELKINYQHTGGNKVFTDKKLLKQVLMNLIGNAIKFTVNNESVEVKSEVTDGKINLLISDKGIGISEEDQKHLFERFFRAHNATNIQGTGLGLSIVARHIEILKGEIKLQSTLEEGTTFSITMPADLSVTSKASKG